MSKSSYGRVLVIFLVFLVILTTGLLQRASIAGKFKSTLGPGRTGSCAVTSRRYAAARNTPKNG